jgi:pimeloyl-ACP methyl ester carboxylesterase
MSRLIASLCGSALLAFVMSANAAAPPVPVLNWNPCSTDGADCAMAQVPLDYDEPAGATTYIVLARYAADPATKIGTVFVNFGGPGVSGVARLIGSGFGLTLRALLLGRFDVVAFDPRGVGYSDPIQCFDTEGDRAAFNALQPIFPYFDEQERPYFDAYSSLAARCLGRGQPIALHMSTADAARDLDLLRQAVDDERITYLGFSYGSYLGNTYANMFPDKVRALAIDGVLNPLIWTIGRQISSDRVAAAAVAEEFNRLCDEAAAVNPAYCFMSGPQGAAATYAAVAESLKQTPIVLPGGSLYTYDMLIAQTVGCMYTPEQWPACANFVALLASALQGDGDAATRADATLRGIVDTWRSADAGRAYNNQFDASLGVMCADTQYRNPFAYYAALDGWAAKGSVFGPYWWWFNVSCARWPLSPDRYAGPWTARTSAPVLVIGNYFDPATDYAGAQAAAKWLKNARLLSYAGWGHCAFPRANACVVGHVVRYLLDGSLPPEGTVCPANPSPFLPAAPGSSTVEAAKGLSAAGLPMAVPKM